MKKRASSYENLLNSKQPTNNTPVHLYNNINDTSLNKAQTAKRPKSPIKKFQLDFISKSKPKDALKTTEKQAIQKKPDMEGKLINLRSICLLYASKLPMLCEVQTKYVTTNEISFDMGAQLIIAEVGSKTFAVCELNCGARLEVHAETYSACLVNQNPHFDKRSIYSLHFISQLRPLPERMVSVDEFRLGNSKVEIGDILEVIKLENIKFDSKKCEKALKVLLPNGNVAYLLTTMQYKFDCHYKTIPMPLKTILSNMSLPVRICLSDNADDKNNDYANKYYTLVEFVQRQIVVCYTNNEKHQDKYIETLFELWPEGGMELKVLNQSITVPTIRELYMNASKVIPIRLKQKSGFRKLLSFEYDSNATNSEKSVSQSQSRYVLQQPRLKCKRSNSCGAADGQSMAEEHSKNVRNDNDSLNNSRQPKLVVDGTAVNKDALIDKLLVSGQKDRLEIHNLRAQLNVLTNRLSEVENLLIDKENEVKFLKLPKNVLPTVQNKMIEIDGKQTERYNDHGYESMDMIYDSTTNVVTETKKFETISFNDLKAANPEQVLDILKSLNLDRYRDAFLNDSINGELLLELTDEILEHELGISSKLHRKKILLFIKKYKTSTDREV